MRQEAPDGTPLSDVAVVVIGRNEGDRLVRCLESVAGRAAVVVYVDSGSTDGSVDRARQLGAEVLMLDLTRPFTAARARNAGFQRALAAAPAITFVQFVDGDCEVDPRWLTTARETLASRNDVAVTFGRRRERFPEHTVYNRLCDLEWAVPIGEVRSCGGDAMFRVAALTAVGGYREDLVAGEEPELCVRVRLAGFKVLSTGAPMTLHDANMTRLSQWWTRSVRCGWAFAAGSHLHGRPPERHFVHEARRAWIWTLGPPALAIILWVLIGRAALVVLSVYPLQVARLYFARRRLNRYALIESIFQVAGKFPELIGQVRFRLDLLLGRDGRLIEYK